MPIDTSRQRSRWLINNLGENINATFQFIHGDHQVNSLTSYGHAYRDIRWGVTDLTLLPLISRAMITYGYQYRRPQRNSSKLGDVARSVIRKLGFFLQLPRALVTSILMLVAMPFVVTAHGIKELYIRRSKNDVLQLKGHLSSNNREITLGEYLAQQRQIYSSNSMPVSLAQLRVVDQQSISHQSLLIENCGNTAHNRNFVVTSDQHRLPAGIAATKLGFFFTGSEKEQAKEIMRNVECFPEEIANLVVQYSRS